jgi:transmembrane sensor
MSAMDELEPYFEIAELAGKFLKGEITGEEQARLSAWLTQDDRHSLLWNNLTRESYLQQQLDSFPGGDQAAAWQKVLSAIRSAPAGSPEATRPSGRILMRMVAYTAAAAMVLMICYLGFRRPPSAAPGARETKVATRTLEDIHPGSTKASLVLGNGQVVPLGQDTKDTIHEEDGTKAAAVRNTLYYARAGANLTEVTYNSMITPRGGEYKVILSDGTQVWLNAASSIRYPTRFTGPDRKVYLQGEAYLEVAPDPDHPFIVSTARNEVAVLGTSFNIKAYADDAYDRTSLIEGKVRISTTGGDTVTLKPGMQGLVKEGRIQAGEGNLQEALAWRNGLFIFEHESLENICKKLSRWYNVDFTFTSPQYRSLHFTGRLKRTEQITGLIQALESTCHLHFEQSGFTLSVGGR